MWIMSESSIDDLRARLQSLPREALRQIVEDAVNPRREDALAPDGSRMIRVPAQGGRTLSFRFSADDLRL